MLYYSSKETYQCEIDIIEEYKKSKYFEVIFCNICIYVLVKYEDAIRESVGCFGISKSTL